MMNEDKLFEKRDSICVSHYPPPYKNPDSNQVKEYLNLNTINLNNNKNAVLYIHVPFCDIICPFCPFNKYLKEESKIELYLKTIDKEIELYSNSKYIKSIEFGSFALGGGTPSALSIQQLCSIINKCKNKFNFSRDIEISVEGNPANYSRDKLKASFEVGVNRVSFGVQTFNESMAKVIGVPHTIEQSVKSIKYAHNYGCNNVGIDLIYNIPGQSIEQWKEDLNKAVELQLEHITIFSQIVAPFTKLFKQIETGQIPHIGNIEKEIKMYRIAEDILLSAGYEQYSVYDFAKPNKVNLHALYYFSHQNELVGIGPSAFGYLNNFMYINSGQLNDYVEALDNNNFPVIYGEKASYEETIHGTMAKGLRLLKISKKMFNNKFGIDVEKKFKKQIIFLKEKGLIEEDDYEVKLTRKGKVWGNNICKMFFSDTFKNTESIQREILAKGIIKR